MAALKVHMPMLWIALVAACGLYDVMADMTIAGASMASSSNDGKGYIDVGRCPTSRDLLQVHSNNI